MMSSHKKDTIKYDGHIMIWSHVQACTIYGYVMYLLTWTLKKINIDFLAKVESKNIFYVQL